MRGAAYRFGLGDASQLALAAHAPRTAPGMGRLRLRRAGDCLRYRLGQGWRVCGWQGRDGRGQGWRGHGELRWENATLLPAKLTLHHNLPRRVGVLRMRSASLPYPTTARNFTSHPLRLTKLTPFAAACYTHSAK